MVLQIDRGIDDGNHRVQVESGITVAAAQYGLLGTLLLTTKWYVWVDTTYRADSAKPYHIIQ
jgi:hypothetical protein